MDFYAILDQVIVLLRQRQRVTYRALKVHFQLDDEALEALKEELIEAQHLAADEAGRILLWTGDAGPMRLAASVSASLQDRPPLTYTPPYLSEKILTSRSALEGERKQVTVLFADLKGSTELIRDLDPEAALRLLDPALQRMMDAVHRYEGTVNQVLGDGIMALFGAPVAHEDHAVRACYAALAMQAAMRQYAEEIRRSHGLEMQARVGLNSGEVVVRSIGNDLHMDYSAVGQTTHLAARMEQLATPGSIRLTAATRRLAAELVQVNTLGRFPVKGLPEPVEVFELVGASTIRRRLQASAVRGLTRFVGRHTEYEAIRQAWAQAEAGHGQVVAIVGEAGVGKSRLVYEVVHASHTQRWCVLESASVSYGKATSYFPVIELLKHYVHVEDSDDVCTRRAKVTGRVLTLDETLQNTLPVLLSLLDALPDDSPFLQLDPQQRSQRALEALKRLLLRESQEQPLLLVFEDLHWIDAATQALLDLLVESLPTARVLLLVNYRPEYQHGWVSKTYCTQVRLDPLPPANAVEILQMLVGHAPDLESLTPLLIERTGGNPFFLEESVRTLVETGVLVGTPGAYRLTTRLHTIEIPVTVQVVLAARIDRLLPEEKRLLQTAAVIGHEVSFPLLQTIAECTEDALHRGLAHLQAAEFLFETRLFPDLEYTFKHALTHEVAYGSLLQERRQVLHAQIVDAIEQLAPDRLAEQVERLAHHALQGKVWNKVLVYGRQAGAKAAGRSAFREAAAAFEQALGALQHLPESRAMREQAIDLRFELSRALHPLGESVRLLDHLRQAEALAERIGDPRRLGQLASYIATSLWQVGDLDGSLASAQRALDLATDLGDVGLQVTAHFSLGQSYWAMSNHRQAAEVFKRCVEILHGTPLQERFGMATIPAVTSRAFLAWCLAELGAFAEGCAYGEEAIRLTEVIEHPFSLALTCAVVGHLSLRQGAMSQSIRLLEQGLALGEDLNLPLVIQVCNAQLGTAYALSGRLLEALPLLERALEQSAAIRLNLAFALYAVWLGEGYLLAGRVAEARPLGQRALEAARSHNQLGHQAYALRFLGEIAAHGEPPDADQAIAHYRQALALAEELGMRPLQAHCHHGLGTLYATVGQGEQACTALTMAIEMYRAMDMTFWMPQAEVALAQAEERE